MSPEVVFPHLGITIQKLSKVAFSIGGLSIYWYGIAIVLGVGLGTLAGTTRAWRSGQSPGVYLDFLFYALIGSIIGARLYYVAFSWDNYRNNLLGIFAIREGGLALYGAVIGAFATAVIYTKVKKINFWLFVDTAVPGLILGQAIGRWGNFFNREAFGGYTDSLFAMRYLASQAGLLPDAVMDHVISAGGPEYIQVHPTFLYESAWCTVVFLLLIFYTRRKKVNGEVMLLYLAGYGFGRFFIEGLRTDQLIIGHTGIPVSQVVSAALVVGGACAFVIRRKRAAAAGQAAGLPEAGGEREMEPKQGQDSSHHAETPEGETRSEADAATEREQVSSQPAETPQGEARSEINAAEE